MKLKREDRREEVAGITTAILLVIITICAIAGTLQLIFNIL